MSCNLALISICSTASTWVDNICMQMRYLTENSHQRNIFGFKLTLSAIGTWNFPMANRVIAMKRVNLILTVFICCAKSGYSKQKRV